MNNEYFEVKLIIDELNEGIPLEGFDKQTFENLLSNLYFIYTTIEVPSLCNDLRISLLTYLSKVKNANLIPAATYSGYTSQINTIYSKYTSLVDGFSDLTRCYMMLFRSKTLTTDKNALGNFSVSTIYSLIQSRKLIDEYIRSNELLYAIYNKLIDLYLFDTHATGTIYNDMKSLVALALEAGYINDSQVSDLLTLCKGNSDDFPQRIAEIFNINLAIVSNEYESPEPSTVTGETDYFKEG